MLTVEVLFNSMGGGSSRNKASASPPAPTTVAPGLEETEDELETQKQEEAAVERARERHLMQAPLMGSEHNNEDATSAHAEIDVGADADNQQEQNQEDRSKKDSDDDRAEAYAHAGDDNVETLQVASTPRSKPSAQSAFCDDMTTPATSKSSPFGSLHCIQDERRAVLVPAARQPHYDAEADYVADDTGYLTLDLFEYAGQTLHGLRCMTDAQATHLPLSTSEGSSLPNVTQARTVVSRSWSRGQDASETSAVDKKEAEISQEIDEEAQEELSPWGLGCLKLQSPEDIGTDHHVETYFGSFLRGLPNGWGTHMCTVDHEQRRSAPGLEGEHTFEGAFLHGLRHGLGVDVVRRRPGGLQWGFYAGMWQFGHRHGHGVEGSVRIDRSSNMSDTEQVIQ